MKLQLRYLFASNEAEARAFVDRENRAHPRRKHKAKFTQWQSSSPTDPARFVVWYYN